VSNRGKLRLAVFWVFLGVATIFGAVIDPEQIEGILRIMNPPKVEVVLEKGDSPAHGHETGLHADVRVRRAKKGKSRLRLAERRAGLIQRLLDWIGL
jgi:hypothetical protein